MLQWISSCCRSGLLFEFAKAGIERAYVGNLADFHGHAILEHRITLSDGGCFFEAVRFESYEAADGFFGFRIGAVSDDAAGFAGNADTGANEGVAWLRDSAGDEVFEPGFGLRGHLL